MCDRGCSPILEEFLLKASDSKAEMFADEALLDERPGEGLPAGRTYHPTGAPTYHLKLITLKSEVKTYDRFHKDPHLFLCGAPSSFHHSVHPVVKSFFGRERREALLEGAKRTITLEPRGNYIIMQESMKLSNSKTYTISAKWVADSDNCFEEEHSTQFPSPPSK